ncbi:MAG: T9SS type A sorting domain-containing protein [Salibacteraceae bacterium]
MKTLYSLFATLLLSTTLTTAVLAQGLYLPPDKDQETPSTAMVLIENQGQLIDFDGNACSNVGYYMNNSAPSIYAGNEKVSLVKIELDSLPTDSSFADSVAVDSMKYYQIDMQFITEGNVINVAPTPVTEVNQYFSYFLDYLPSGGKTNVPAFNRIVYEDVWPGIDIHLTTNLIGPKLYFVIAPNALPQLIDLKFTGQDDINVLTGGALDFILGNTNIQLEELDAYEVDPLDDEITNLTWKPTWKNPNNGERVTIETGTYNTDNYLVLTCSKKVGQLAAAIQGAAMNWSTYVGTQGRDQFNDLTHDPNNNNELIAVGQTSANKFGKLEGFTKLEYKASEDGVIAKFEETGRLKWVAYYGTDKADYVSKCAINSDGDIYFFATLGGNIHTTTLQPSATGNFNLNQYYWDARVLGSINSSGAQLTWATYFEGKVKSMIFDNNDNLYAVGHTNLNSQLQAFPITARSGVNVYNQTSYAGSSSDGFVLRVDQNDNLTWLTYFGSSGLDIIHDITVDPQNNIYFCGQTNAQKTTPINWCKTPYNGFFPLCNYAQSSIVQDQTLRGGTDAFVGKLLANGQLNWTRFLGDSATDIATSITCNNTSDPTQPFYISVGGHTYSKNFSVSNRVDQYQRPNANSLDPGNSVQIDMFVAKFDTTFNKFYSALIGGGGQEQMIDLVADSANSLYGYGTTSTIDASGIGKAPGGFCCGWCHPTEIPTCNNFSAPAYAEPYRGHNKHNGFIFKINSDLLMPWASFYETGALKWDGGGLVITDKGELYVAQAGDSKGLPIFDPGNNAYVKFNSGNYDAFISKFSDAIGQNLAVSMSSIEPKKGEIKLYPNPTSSNSILESQVGDINNLNIYNINGQLIESWKPKSDHTEIKLGGQPSGIYFIQYETKEGVDSKKLIVE